MRTLSPDYLNSVANHPQVRPWLKGEGDVDLSELISNPQNIALQYEGGGWVLLNQGGASYDVHSMFLPEHRGENVRAELADAMKYVFLETDAHRLTTFVPKGNAAALALSRIAGFRKWFSREGGDYYRLDIEDWIQKTEDCGVAGEVFHKRLEEAKVSAGSSLEVHEDDSAHDHAAGAAFLMCQRGNPAKAVWLYNAWANVAGYSPISLVSVNPMIIDVVDAVLEGPDMKVILCR